MATVAIPTRPSNLKVALGLSYSFHFFQPQRTVTLSMHLFTHVLPLECPYQVFPVAFVLGNSKYGSLLPHGATVVWSQLSSMQIIKY